MTLKLAPHWMLGGSGLSRWLQAGCTSVKYAGAYPQGEPIDDNKIVARVLNQDTFHLFSDTPERAAKKYIEEELSPVIRANPHLHTFEALNEPDWKDDDNPANTPRVMAWVCEFLYHSAKRLRDRNIIPVVGNWSVGNPDYFAWNYSEWMLRATKDSGAIIGRHGYGPLDRDYAYRYEKDAEIFTGLGYPEVKFYLTEVGLDNVLHFTPWKTYYGNTTAGFERYWREWIVPFELRIRRDARVLGAHLFTLGTGGSNAWDPFDVSNLEITNIAERMMSLSHELGPLPVPQESPEVEVIPFALPIPIDPAHTPAFGRLALHIIDAIHDFNERGDVYAYGPPALVWWQLLRPGDRVKAGKSPTDVYRDFGGVTLDRRVPLGQEMTVHADGVQGDWVQVYKGATLQLWVRGNDLAQV